MKVYRMSPRMINIYINQKSSNRYEAFAWYIELTRKPCFNLSELHAYGFNDSQINFMLSKNLIKKIYISNPRSRHKNRPRKAPSKKEKPDTKERRRLLLDTVILPEFGEPNIEGIYEIPKEISAIEVVESLENYQDIRDLYGHSVYSSVKYDIKNLGIPIADEYKTMKKRWPGKLEDDPNTLKRLMDLAASGRQARWEKYRNDPEYQKTTREKLIANSIKGTEAKKRIQRKRHRALRTFLRNEFGDIHSISYYKLTDYLNSRQPEFAEKYYNGHASATTVKRDLRAIRR